MTTTITPNIEALDLRPILELRPEAEQLIARLRADDESAVERARHLLKIERRIIEAVRTAIDEFGHSSPDAVSDRQDLERREAVYSIVNALGTGDLDYELDEMLARVYVNEHGPAPDDAVGLAGFDGWVHLVEYVNGGMCLVRFPGTGEERRVGAGQLRPVPMLCDRKADLTWWEREVWCNSEHGQHIGATS